MDVRVVAARDLGDIYGKDIVVIVSYDHATQHTNITTWGRDPADKANAAAFGKTCSELLKLDPSTEEVHQDYRLIEAGERAQIVDHLVRAGKAADHAIRSVMACRTGITDEALQDVLDALQRSLEQTAWKLIC